MNQPNIDETLKQRGDRYGEFDEHARITQNIKAAIADSRRWTELDDDMRECLEMVAHKIGRIVNGDPDYIDSWTDIIGYTRLVEKRLIDEQQTAKVFTFPMGGKSDHQADAMAAAIPVPKDTAVADNTCDCPGCVLRRALVSAGMLNTKRA